MFRNSFFVALMVFCISFASAKAAQIIETGSGLTTVKGCSLLINGQIAPGDAERLENILRKELGEAASSTKHPVNAEFEKTFVVCLSGPGGSYLEGIRIGELFAKYNVATVVPDNQICESACAIAFLGGQTCCDSKSKPIVQRYLFPGSKIGFHAPSLKLGGSGEYSRENALKAYDLGLEAISRLRKNADKFSISDAFMAKIFSHREEGFYYIRTLDDAEFNKLLLSGYRPRKLKRDTTQAACWNAWNWHVTGHGGVWFNFEEGGYSSTSTRHWNDVFRKFPTQWNYIDRATGTYVFYPFDGSVNCQVRTIKHDGQKMLSIVISEGNVNSDPDPHIRGIFRPTILMRGNRELESTR